MAATMFVPRVVYKNKSNLSLGAYPKIRIPRGVRAVMPIGLTAAQMIKTGGSTYSRHSKGLGGVTAGLTDATFSLHFEKPFRQWKKVLVRRLPFRLFQGGKVFLQVDIAVYVQQGYLSDKKLVGVILEHEYEHVADEIDVITRFMPVNTRKDSRVKSYLVAPRKLMVDKSFSHWITQRGLEEWVRKGVWASEHNRRQKARDSGRRWNRFRARIDALMRGQSDPGP